MNWFEIILSIYVAVAMFVGYRALRAQLYDRKLLSTPEYPLSLTGCIITSIIITIIWPVEFTVLAFDAFINETRI